MGNSMKLTDKLKVVWYLFTEPRYKNILTVTCGLCGSSNLILEKSRKSLHTDRQDRYHASYKCRKCGAVCDCVQNWAKWVHHEEGFTE